MTNGSSSDIAESLSGDNSALIVCIIDVFVKSEMHTSTL